MLTPAQSLMAILCALEVFWWQSLVQLGALISTSVVLLCFGDVSCLLARGELCVQRTRSSAVGDRFIQCY